LGNTWEYRKLPKKELVVSARNLILAILLPPDYILKENAAGEKEMLFNSLGG